MIGSLGMVGRVVALLAAGAAVVGIGWWIVAPRIEVQRQRAEQAEAQLADARSLNEQQAAVIGRYESQGERLAEIERSLQALGQRISRNAAQQSRALEELKRNDQTIVDYLALPVPVELGMLYARPETTDPAAYRAGAAVQPGAVQPAISAAAGSD